MGPDATQQEVLQRRGLTRCVLLVESPGTTPAMLLDGLRRRGAQVTVVNHGPGAMVALQGASALVVVDPTGSRRGQALVAAVQRHLPHVVCWQYQAADGLTPWGAAKAQPIMAPPRAVAMPPQPSSPSPPHAEPLNVEPAAITPEELAMLVGPLETDLPQ